MQNKDKKDLKQALKDRLKLVINGPLKIAEDRSSEIDQELEELNLLVAKAQAAKFRKITADNIVKAARDRVRHLERQIVKLNAVNS